MIPPAMDFLRVWAPYLYLYGVGGLCFLLGIVLILRSRSCRPSRPSDRRWLGVLIFGYFWYAALHGLWTLAALHL